jgi:uncharacterized protein (TIGR02118 family)
VKVVAVVRGDTADVDIPGLEAHYVPVAEGTTGRADPVAAVVVLRGEALPKVGLPVEAYRVDERVQWDRGPVAVFRLAFVRRKQGLTHREFVDHWTGAHAPLARRHHPTLHRYTQNVVVEALTPGAPEVDGIAELGFRTLHDVRERTYDSPAGAEIIRRDVRRFLDVPAGWRMLARASS